MKLKAKGTLSHQEHSVYTLEQLLEFAVPHDPDLLPNTTRAVERRVELGPSVGCIACGNEILYEQKALKVIANVYDYSRWRATAEFHSKCYTELNMPFGDPSLIDMPRRAIRQS